MKTLLKVCFSLASLLFLSSPVSAATSARYRIDLQDGSRVYARDLPVRRGTILTFHQHPGGALTGVPAELVLRVEPGSGAQAAAPKSRPKLQGGVSSGLEAGEIFIVGPAEGLNPGEMLVLGPTGEGGTVVSQQPPGVAAGANGAMNGAPPLGAYGGNVNTNGTLLTGPNGLPVAPSSTDLSRAQAAQALGQTAAAPNGFPATSAPTTIGPDGFPVLSPGVPGSSAPAATTVPVPVIGPNGTPVLAQPGAPQPIIGPNGTPVLAPPGTPGAAGPVIGPNGTPVLAPPGAPGTAAPVIGPNGTPVLAPPGAPGAAAPNTGPNGTPAPAPAGPGGPPSN